MKIMASIPITSWQKVGEKVETVTDFVFVGSKITADSDYSHEIKRSLPFEKESYVKPRQCIKKQRHHLPTKIHIVKALLFPVIRYGFYSWTIKKTEDQRIDAFELWYWRRLLRVL